MSLTAEQKTDVKKIGFLENKTEGNFSCRIVTVNGVLTTEQNQALNDVARQYGDGRVALTARLTVELPGIQYENIQKVKSVLEESGLITGGTGSKVRPVVGCKGTLCIHGLYDTLGLAEKIHDEFYVNWNDVKLPHKFKIGVTGCPNNCIKTDLNDFGIMGVRPPDYDADECMGCSQCLVTPACPIGSTKLVDGYLVIDDTCNDCGKCIGTCSADAITGKETQYRIFLGGMWGKTKRPGTPMPRYLTKDEIMPTIEKAILIYREQGITGERFGVTVDRIGAEKFINQVLAGDVLDRKQEILDAQLHLTGGAKC